MDPIQKIKEKLDIVDIIRERIALLPAGKNFKAPCPFHKEKTPSFVVSPDRQTWHCFGSCGEGGDVFSFVMKYDGLEFYEALQLLAEKAGVELQKVSPQNQKEFGVLYDINRAATDFFVSQLRETADAMGYMHERGVQEETIEIFEIGYAPYLNDALIVNLVNAGFDVHDIERAGLCFKTERGTYMDRFRGRIMFPLLNSFGKIVGFSGRILPAYDNENIGKYVNTPETSIFNKSKLLYGFDKTRQYIREKKNVYVIEGQMDMIMMYQDGVRNVIATSGTALTKQHLELLQKNSETITFSFDNDEAGKHATYRAIDMAHEMDCLVHICSIPDAKDAAEFVRKNPHMLERTLAAHTQTALEYYTQEFLQKGIDSSREDIRTMLAKIIHIQSPLEQGRWIKKIATNLRLPEHTILEEFQMLKKKTKIPEEKKVQQNQEQDTHITKPKTRHETIALHCTLLILRNDIDQVSFQEYLTYFPHPYDKILGYDATTGSDDAVGTLRTELSMKASLSLEAGEDGDKELQFLLRELKKEFLKERTKEITMQIRLYETKGQQPPAELLKEFDEITKLINNEVQ